MRRLLLSSKKIPFRAGPPGSRHCHSHPILSNRLNSIAACGPPYALAHPILSSLPPHFHSHSRRLAPARFLLDSVVRALPSFSRSQSADRFAIHRSDRWRNAVARTRRLGKQYLAALLPGQYPQATWVAFILATRNSSSPTRSTDAIRPLAVGPAACLRANQSSTPHTDLLGGPP